jgi:hypothetical protein
LVQDINVSGKHTLNQIKSMFICHMLRIQV